jgi:prefoldin subunit 5
MLRAELELVKAMIAQAVEPAEETADKRFEKIEAELADIKKAIKDLGQSIKKLTAPELPPQKK